jgi:hypothetical protein
MEVAKTHHVAFTSAQAVDYDKAIETSIFPSRVTLIDLTVKAAT